MTNGNKGRGSSLIQMTLVPQDRVRTGSGRPRVGKPRVRLTTGPPASTLQLTNPPIETPQHDAMNHSTCVLLRTCWRACL